MRNEITIITVKIQINSWLIFFCFLQKWHICFIKLYFSGKNCMNDLFNKISQNSLKNTNKLNKWWKQFIFFSLFLFFSLYWTKQKRKSVDRKTIWFNRLFSQTSIIIPFSVIFSKKLFEEFAFWVTKIYKYLYISICVYLSQFFFFFWNMIKLEKRSNVQFRSAIDCILIATECVLFV